MPRTRSRIPISILCYGILTVGCILSIFPYLLSVLTAFKGQGQLFETLPWEPALPPSTSAFDRLFASGFGSYVLNTVLVAVATTAGQLVFAVLAAYAFARLKFPGRDLLFWVYLSTLMVPPVVTMIPLYLMMQELGLVDTWAGLMLPTMLGTPYAIFLLRQFFRTIPADLEDAARIDGAGKVRTLVSVILPLSKPIIVTVTTMAVVGSWNSFLWPLIITSNEDKRMLSVGLALFKSEIGVDYNAVTAGSLIALVPLLILFIVFQRFIVRSVAVTGLK
jgi:multiple sugar transport system permease protein